MHPSTITTLRTNALAQSTNYYSDKLGGLVFFDIAYLASTAAADENAQQDPQEP